MKKTKTNDIEKKSKDAKMEDMEKNSSASKKKIIPAYQKKNEPVDKKAKKKLDKKLVKSRITIILIAIAVLLVGLAIYGIVSFINYNKHKPYIGFEETMKTYGFDKVYNNGSAKTGESITKSEAIKMVLSAVFNTSDISGFAYEPEGEDNYENAMWVEYAKFREIIGDADITKDNAKDKATYIEVIRYLANAKSKILEKELDSKPDLKVKDINKYKPDEQVAIEDMIANEIITIKTKKIKGNSNIFKGQMNELISNFVIKYNTITVNGEKVNINEDKMPSNKDQYPYTLVSVDKSVYEKEFYVDDENNFKSPKELYSVKKEYYTQIQEVAEGYYDTILNIDYNTILKDKISQKLENFSVYGVDDNYIKEYVDYVKEHKIVIEGKSTVMFPTIYFDGLQYVVRMKLEFEIKNSNTDYNILYLDLTMNDKKNIKYDGKKFTLYIDAKMGDTLSGINAIYVNDIPIINLLIKNDDNIIRE